MSFHQQEAPPGVRTGSEGVTSSSMRCPQCTNRNSVAAKVCSECGAPLPRKPVPTELKFGIGFVAAILVLIGIALAFIPRLNDPQIGLANAGKALANGPKSKSDAAQLTTDFDKAVQTFLEKQGNLSAKDLAKKLQSALPGSLFEVNAFDLPRNMKLVEIDQGLRAFDYALFQNEKETKIIPVPGFEVFDVATDINDSSGPVLVLVGHSAGQPPHKPLLKVLAILPGTLKDLSEQAVPKISGEGNANLASNKRDVVANISLLSLVQNDKLFDIKPGETFVVPDETIPVNLVWKDGRYSAMKQPGIGQLSAISKVARWANNEINVPGYSALLNRDSLKIQKKINANRASTAPGTTAYTVRTTDATPSKLGGPKVAYLLQNSLQAIKVELSKGKSANGYIVSALELKLPEAVVAAAPTTSTATDTTTAETKTPDTTEIPDTTKSIAIAEPTVKPTEKSTPEEHTPAKITIKETPDTPEKTPETITETTPETSSTTTESTTGATLFPSSGKIKLRSGPSTDFKPITELEESTPITVIGKRDGWYKVSAAGKEGYVYGGLIKSKTADAFTTATIRKSKTVTDSNHKSLTTTHVGDHVVVIGGIQNDKYKVQLANGKIGFVDKDAIDVAVEAPQLVP